MGRSIYRAADQIDELEVCDYAAQLLMEAGFELCRTSSTSEARYYRFPGRHGVIRVAAHRGGRKSRMLGDPPVLERITFCGDVHADPGKIRVRLDAVFNRTAAAIGRYLMKAGASEQLGS